MWKPRVEKEDKWKPAKKRNLYHYHKCIFFLFTFLFLSLSALIKIKSSPQTEIISMRRDGNKVNKMKLFSLVTFSFLSSRWRLVETISSAERNLSPSSSITSHPVLPTTVVLN